MRERTDGRRDSWQTSSSVFSKWGEVVIDGLVSVYGRFTGSDGAEDENGDEDTDESEPIR